VADETGVLVVHRPAGSWRQNRGRPDVRVDGRVRGQLGSGEQVEYRLSAGEYRVQVGRPAMAGTSRQVFFGSPPLTLLIRPGAEVRVRVEPSAVPATQQAVLAESTFRLVEDGPGAPPNATPSPALDQPAGGWMRSPYTRGMLDKPQPWKSGRAAVTVLMLLYTSWLLTAVAVLGRHPRPVGWIWITLATAVTVSTLISWVSLFRARRRASTRQPTP